MGVLFGRCYPRTQSLMGISFFRRCYPRTSSSRLFYHKIISLSRLLNYMTKIGRYSYYMHINQNKHMSVSAKNSPLSEFLFLVQACKTALGGFAIAAGQILACFFHCFYNHIKGYFPAVPQKACKIDGI